MHTISGVATSIPAFVGRAPRGLDRGIVNIIVGFAPLKPSEFVVLRLRHISGTRKDS